MFWSHRPDESCRTGPQARLDPVLVDWAPHHLYPAPCAISEVSGPCVQKSGPHTAFTKPHMLGLGPWGPGSPLLSPTCHCPAPHARTGPCTNQHTQGHSLQGSPCTYGVWWVKWPNGGGWATLIYVVLKKKVSHFVKSAQFWKLMIYH